MLSNQLQLNYKPIQLTLPVNYEHLIENNDSVVSFLEVIGGLNLSKFIKTSKKGRQEYDPELMLRIILFAYMEGIHSLRKLEKACRTDIRFMYLAEDHRPSHMAFQRFIDHKLKYSIKDILTAVSKHLIKIDNIYTDIIYVDGTKIEANATKFSFVWKKAVLKHQARLYLKITEELKSIKNNLSLTYDSKESYKPGDLIPILKDIEIIMNDEKIDFVHGKGSRKSPVQRHYEAIYNYMYKLDEYGHHLEVCGERNSYSKTDHDATFMHGKEDYYSKTGIFKPYYNLQIGVSDEYILHLDVSWRPTDMKTWVPFFESYKERYGTLPTYPVADAGYGSYDNYMYNLINNMKLYMKYPMYSKEKEKKFSKREFNIKNIYVLDNILKTRSGEVYEYSHEYIKYGGTYPQYKQVYKYTGNNPDAPKTISKDNIMLILQSEAKRNLDSELGIALRIQRSIQVEGAFGDIKHNLEYARLHRKGKNRVELELSLIVLGYNLRKYHNKKYR